MNNGIYIHIPFCKSKCGYCSFNSCTDLKMAPLYLPALIAEIQKRADKLNIYDTIYFGGGTPSVLTAVQFNNIMSAIRENFSIAENCEITVEVNPESCEKNFIENLAAQKVNRISLGLQSDNDEILFKIGRIHNFGDFLKALNTILNCGIENISADLITGLPGQSVKDFQKTLKNIVTLPLKHISFYALTIEEGTPFFNNGYTVDPDTQAQMYSDGISILKENGFYRYEVSNFAKTGFESRHNSKYWDLTPYIGLGLSAHSYINRERIENTDSLIDYLSGKTVKKSTIIGDKETIEEYIMLALRTSKGLDTSYLKDNLKYDILKEKQIEKLLKLKAIILENGFIKLFGDAFYILNSIILELI